MQHPILAVHEPRQRLAGPGASLESVPLWAQHRQSAGLSDATPGGPGQEPRPLLVVGATGTLGHAFSNICALRGLQCQLLGREQLDIALSESIQEAFDLYMPWAVINAAGYVRVDLAEHEIASCFRENTEGARKLAHACSERSIKLVTFSSDLVFDGEQREPYLETHPVCPLNVYGRSKAVAEALVLACLPSALVVRTSAFFGPWDRHNFVAVTLDALSRAVPMVAASDSVVSPTYLPDLVHACLDSLLSGVAGVRHLANSEHLTWHALAQRIAALAGHDPGLVKGVTMRSLGLPARRPAYSALGSQWGTSLPSLDDALSRYLLERE